MKDAITNHQKKETSLKTIPFSKVSMAGNESRYLNEVLESGWLTTSSKAFSFEEQFAHYIGVKYACAVNSCTSALHLAIEAIGIGKGDKVLVPSLTFTASAEIIRYVGADPVFMDVEYDTCLASPSILEESIKKHPDAKALILVHYGGQAPVMKTWDRKGIIDICNKSNIAIIEDAAHAFPAKTHNQYIGTFGKAGCFSFYANKSITTGEGGMLVTHDKTIYERAKVMRLHGISRDCWARYTAKGPCWEYDIIAPGFKYNMPDINAAIGLAQLEKAEYFRLQRQRCASFYYDNLKDLQVIDLPHCLCPMENHAWHLFPIILRPESRVKRNEFIELLAKEGIGTSVHYKPLYRMTYYKQTYKLSPKDFPNTERIWNGVVSLPIYPELSDEDLRYICCVIWKILS
jgi:dTDP-4-amino-4,6-dideoxygalactose transaminase